MEIEPPLPGGSESASAVTSGARENCGGTRGRYYYASQSNDDNNEGFDVSIPETLAGTYEVWLAWPDGAVGCGGAPGALFGWEIATWGAD